MGGQMLVVDQPDVFRLYNDFYDFLSRAGVDAVKTDAQFMIDTWVSAKTRRELIKEYQDAWTTSALRHFSIRAISCMSQVPSIMLYSQIRQNRPAMLVRNSDDFFPDIAASHPWHVWANAHNALFMQHLNVVPDWDMFQTVHAYSAFHAAARCVSGGPIYITDIPGQHNLQLIGQMTGTTIRGKTVIFRPSVLGRSIDQYVGYHDDALLKIGSYHGRTDTGTPILGVFNVAARPLTDLVPLSRFPGVHASTTYAVRSFSTGRLTRPITVDSPLAVLALSLEERGFEILTAYPLVEFEGTAQKAGETLYVANLGLLGKMTGAAAIVSSTCQRVNDRVVLDARIKALGKLGETSRPRTLSVRVGHS